MGLPMEFVLALGEYLTDAVRDYSLNINEYGVKALDEPKSMLRPKAFMRPSNFSQDKCPKLAAAEKFKIVQTTFTEEKLWTFALALYAAMLAKVAIKKRIVEDAEARRENLGEQWTAMPEVAVNDGGNISGVIDLMISIRTIDKTVYQIPIEIKRTDADMYSGVQAYAVWQCICYMYMLESDFGYVLTLYSGKKEAYKTWPIVRVEGGWQIFDGIKPATFKDEYIPRLPTGENFFSDETFRWLFTEGLKYGREFDSFVELRDKLSDKGASQEELIQLQNQFLARPGPHTNPVSKPCVEKYSLPEAYKRSGLWGDAGDPKRGTGVAIGLCPLYRYCHQTELLSLGYDPDSLPSELPVEDNNGRIVLKRNN